MHHMHEKLGVFSKLFWMLPLKYIWHLFVFYSYAKITSNNDFGRVYLTSSCVEQNASTTSIHSFTFYELAFRELESLFLKT